MKWTQTPGIANANSYIVADKVFQNPLIGARVGPNRWGGLPVGGLIYQGVMLE